MLGIPSIDAYPAAADLVLPACHPACPAVCLGLVEKRAGTGTATGTVDAGTAARPAVAVVIQCEVDTLPGAAGLLPRADDIMAAAVVFITCRVDAFAAITDLRAVAGMAARGAVVVVRCCVDAV